MIFSKAKVLPLIALQVFDTKKIVSVWPVGLGKWMGFTTPIWDFIKKALIGYLEGDDFLNRPIYDILMNRGTFAISIGFLLKVRI
jgi:hypothetical protein